MPYLLQPLFRILLLTRVELVCYNTNDRYHNSVNYKTEETIMPVIFSEKKRQEISRQIKEAALQIFETKGIRKTTVHVNAEVQSI